MRFFLLVFHVLLTLVMIGVILIQRGEDASSGNGLPGSRSGKSFLTRMTAILAFFFFSSCVLMAVLVRKESKIGLEEAVKKTNAIEVDSSSKLDPSQKNIPFNKQKHQDVKGNTDEKTPSIVIPNANSSSTISIPITSDSLNSLKNNSDSKIETKKEMIEKNDEKKILNGNKNIKKHNKDLKKNNIKSNYSKTNKLIRSKNKTSKQKLEY